MTIYFTVDRLRRLQPNQTLEVRRCIDPELPEDLRRHIDGLFPGGISDHGRRYFVLGTFATPVWALETTWEYVRRAHYPHRPSRFTCTYAWQTIEEARAFSANHGNAPIWEVSSDSAFLGNMALLDPRPSCVRTSQSAHQYWQGIEAPMADPQNSGIRICEVLLPPSARIGRMIEMGEQEGE